MQDYNKAISDYTKAIQIDSQNGYAYYWRGTYYKNLSMICDLKDQYYYFKKSQEDFAKAKSLGFKF